MVDVLKKKQTFTSTALRLGTFRLVFSGFFSHILTLQAEVSWSPYVPAGE